MCLQDLRREGAGAEPPAGTGIVVMDNLGAHRPKRIRELIEQRGCELLYLPSYSPDYNPIEEAFAKIKNLPFARPPPGVRRPTSKR